MVYYGMLITPMNTDFILYRCLHAGPLSRANIEQLSANIKSLPKEQLQRNEVFLRRLTETYGACAMLAMENEYVIGYARFYPGVVFDVIGRKHFCCQQPEYAANADMTFVELPSMTDINDPVIEIHCWFIHKDFRGQGISHKILGGILEWAKKHHWKAVKASAACNDYWIATKACTLPLRTFRKHGFKITKTRPSPELKQMLLKFRDGDFGEEGKEAFKKHCTETDVSKLAIYHDVIHTL
jgi:GNAT superfamily N-acetyltransferase